MLMIEAYSLVGVGIRYSPVIGIDTDRAPAPSFSNKESSIVGAAFCLAGCWSSRDSQWPHFQ